MLAWENLCPPVKNVDLMKPVFVSAYFLEGESLPVACNPTTSRNERVQPRSTPKKPLPKVMNARHLSGGKRTKEAIDVQRSSVPQEIYKPPPGSTFFISFLFSHPLSAAGHCFDIVKRDYLFVTLVRNTCNPSPPHPPPIPLQEISHGLQGIIRCRT